MNKKIIDKLTKMKQKCIILNELLTLMEEKNLSSIEIHKILVNKGYFENKDEETASLHKAEQIDAKNFYEKKIN